MPTSTRAPGAIASCATPARAAVRLQHRDIGRAQREQLLGGGARLPARAMVEHAADQQEKQQRDRRSRNRRARRRGSVSARLMAVTRITPTLIGTSMLVRRCRSAARAERKNGMPGIGDRRHGDQRRDPVQQRRASPAPCPARARPRSPIEISITLPAAKPATASARISARPVRSSRRGERGGVERHQPVAEPLHQRDQRRRAARPPPRQARRSRRVVMLTRPSTSAGSCAQHAFDQPDAGAALQPVHGERPARVARGVGGDVAAEVPRRVRLRPRRAALPGRARAARSRRPSPSPWMVSNAAAQPVQQKRRPAGAGSPQCAQAVAGRRAGRRESDRGSRSRNDDATRGVEVALARSARQQQVPLSARRQCGGRRHSGHRPRAWKSSGVVNGAPSGRCAIAARCARLERRGPARSRQRHHGPPRSGVGCTDQPSAASVAACHEHLVVAVAVVELSFDGGAGERRASPRDQSAVRGEHEQHARRPAPRETPPRRTGRGGRRHGLNPGDKLMAMLRARHARPGP